MQKLYTPALDVHLCSYVKCVPFFYCCGELESQTLLDVRLEQIDCCPQGQAGLLVGFEIDLFERAPFQRQSAPS